MADICFHVGLGKTATTYLQRNVFTKFNALGRDSNIPGANSVEQRLASMVCCSEPDIWRANEGKTLADSIHSIAKTTPIFYSTEYWASPPFLYPDNSLQPHHSDQLIFAEHIKNFAEHAWTDRGKVSVLLTVRNQAEWLASYYAQRSSRFKASQGHFEQFIHDLLDTNDFRGAGFLEYDQVVHYIESLLGPGTCTVLAYEEMNTPQFWSELSRAAGYEVAYDADSLKSRDNMSKVDDNSWSLKSRDIFSGFLGPQRVLKWPWLANRKEIRMLKKALKKGDHLVSQQSKREIYLNGQLHNQILSRFENSNRRLESFLGRKVFGRSDAQ